MNSIAIVTGYSSGLGRSISESLLSAGWTVIGVARHRFSDPVENVNGLLLQVQGSVVDQQTVDEAFRRAEELGGANLVVNCAGQGCFGDVGSYSASDVMTAIEGNLVGLIVFSDRAIQHMQDRGGDIVNIMSTAAKKYRPGESVYTAAKWGAKAYTRTVREAIKARKLKIRIFEVYPCGMNTPFWKTAIRPVADGSAFPEPGPIAAAILNAVFEASSSYQQELTFERS